MEIADPVGGADAGHLQRAFAPKTRQRRVKFGPACRKWGTGLLKRMSALRRNAPRLHFAIQRFGLFAPVAGFPDQIAQWTPPREPARAGRRPFLPCILREREASEDAQQIRRRAP